MKHDPNLTNMPTSELMELCRQSDDPLAREIYDRLLNLVTGIDTVGVVLSDARELLDDLL